MTARRTCIVVLGMHRSGTSAVTRLINLLGAALPRTLMGAMSWNPEGHWEPQRLVDLHDQMLREAGSRWDDWRALSLENLLPARRQFYRDEIARIVTEDFGDAPLLVIKDPRICRFVPFFTEALSPLGVDFAYVLMLRHPKAVSASLAVRDQLDEMTGSLLWLRHMLDAEYATRSSRRVVIDYDALLDNWRDTADRLAAGLAINWPSLQHAEALAETELRTDLRHHQRPSDGPTADAPETWASAVYEAVKSDGIEVLEAARQSFDARSMHFGGSRAQLYRRELEFETAAAQQLRIIAARDEEIRNLRLLLTEAERRGQGSRG